MYTCSQHTCLCSLTFPAVLRLNVDVLFLRYGTLLELGEKRKDMLEKSCKKFMLFREANELQQWINEKESALTNEEVGSDLEQVEVLQKKFDDFQKVISTHCVSLFTQSLGYVIGSKPCLTESVQSFVFCRT